MRAREPASFWRENVVAVVILPLVLARMSCQRTQVVSVTVFIILWLGNSLTSFNQDNSANVFGEKVMDNEDIRGVSYLRIREKPLS